MMCDHKKLKLEGISLGPAKLELKFKANMNPRFLLLCYKRTDQTYQLQNAPGLPLEKHSDLRPRFGSKLNGKLLAQLTQDMQTSCFKHYAVCGCHTHWYSRWVYVILENTAAF